MDEKDASGRVALVCVDNTAAKHYVDIEVDGDI